MPCVAHLMLVMLLNICLSDALLKICFLMVTSGPVQGKTASEECFPSCSERTPPWKDPNPTIGGGGG